MENTIFKGDKVLVNKLLYGARLPMSPYEIPWINILFHISRSYLTVNNVHWKYRRIRGFSKCNKNDIVVFNFPDENEVLIKRCIAGPGDTLLIDSAEVYINGTRQEFPYLIKHRYKICTSIDSRRFESCIISPNYSNTFRIHKEGDESCIDLDLYQAKRLIEASLLDSLPRCFNFNPISSEAFAVCKELGWSIDNFGPLIVPKAGTKIKLNHENFNKYKTTIKALEQCDIFCRNDSFFIDNQFEEYYKFENDYYFFMGDNRYNSRDSRYIGLISEQMIIGKTRMLLFSNSKSRSLRERFFRRIK